MSAGPFARGRRDPRRRTRRPRAGPPRRPGERRRAPRDRGPPPTPAGRRCPRCSASAHDLGDAPAGALGGAHFLDASGTQRLEDGIDAVDQHFIAQATLSRGHRSLASAGPRYRSRGIRQRSDKGRRALAAAQDLRQAGAGGKLGAAIDRRDGEIELRALRAPGQRDPDRMKQRLALLSGRRLSPRRRSREIAPCRAAAHPRARSASAVHDGTRAIGSHLAAITGVGQRRLRRCSRTGTRAVPAPDRGDRPTPRRSGSTDARNSRPCASGVIATPACTKNGTDSSASRAGVRHLQIVAVHPRQLLLVEHAGAWPDVVQREPPRQLVRPASARLHRPRAATSR